MGILLRHHLLNGPTDPPGYLYAEGNECISLTGGWTNSGYSYNNNAEIYPVRKEINNLYGTTADETIRGRGVGCGTVKLIDFTSYNYLYWDMMGQSAALMITPTKTNFVSSYILYKEYNSSSVRTIQTIDVRSIAGSYYIVTYSINTNGRWFRTYNMYFNTPS